MCYGMGVVFVFLTLLYISTSVMSTVIQRYFFIPGTMSGTKTDSKGMLREETVSVITAAVKQYREKHSN